MINLINRKDYMMFVLRNIMILNILLSFSSEIVKRKIQSLSISGLYSIIKSKVSH